jgi:hypothetical protein
MVRFNDTPDNDNPGTGGGVGAGNGTDDNNDTTKNPIEFSWLAFKVWITTGIILTSICLGSSWAWRRVERTRRNHGSLRGGLFNNKKKREQLDNKLSLRGKEGSNSKGSAISSESGSSVNNGDGRSSHTSGGGGQGQEGSSHHQQHQQRRRPAFLLGLGLKFAGSSSIFGTPLMTSSPALDSGATTARTSPAGSHGWSQSGRGSSHHARMSSATASQYRASGPFEDSPV